MWNKFQAIFNLSKAHLRPNCSLHTNGIVVINTTLPRFTEKFCKNSNTGDAYFPLIMKEPVNRKFEGRILRMCCRNKGVYLSWNSTIYILKQKTAYKWTKYSVPIQMQII